MIGFSSGSGQYIDMYIFMFGADSRFWLPTNREV